MDTLTVRVELKADSHTDASGALGAQAALAHAIKSYIGINATVKIEATGVIERSVGKARRVIDLRSK